MSRSSEGTKKVSSAQETYVGQSQMVKGPARKDVITSVQCVQEDLAFQVKSINHNGKVNSVNRKDKGRIMVDVHINENTVTMQVDTAADVTIVPEKVAKSIPNLEIANSSSLKGI